MAILSIILKRLIKFIFIFFSGFLENASKLTQILVNFCCDYEYQITVFKHENHLRIDLVNCENIFLQARK